MQDLHTGHRALVPGTVVAARGRHWRIVDAQPHAACLELRLAPIQDAGPTATLLHPFDRLTPVPISDRPRRTSRRRAAEAAAAALLDAHPWVGLRAALAADVHLLAYQLDPALAIFGGHATRVLLADDVGLGKTIQAGLILAELRARHELTRALVLTPAGLREQWERELRERFDLPARTVDASWLAAAGRSLPPRVDPWSLPGVAVVSIDLLKRREMVAQLRESVWDAVVIDEAHHAGLRTERREAAAIVCSHARHVVLITATPHNGDQAEFDALLELGRLTRSEPAMRVFRRSRRDVSPGAAARRTRNVLVRPSAEERAMFALLGRYTSRVWAESARRSDGGASRLAMMVLRKRALSGAVSLVRSIARRIAALADGDPLQDRAQMTLRFDDGLDGELIGDDAQPESILGAPGLGDAGDERSLLERVLEAARGAARVESKQRLLARVLRRAGESVIVFTEYRDTLEDLARALGAVGTAQLHGGLRPADRRHAIDAFTAGRARVLLATDAAAEGLNLHHRCRWVVHYELPWNPARLEQRTGRVDRLGQARRVHAWRLVAAGTDETRVLQQLESRAALSEAQMAQLIFEGAASHPGTEGRWQRQTPGAAAVREAERLQHLRRLRRFEPRASLRPVAATVRARGPFSLVGRRSQLAVRSLRADDAAGRRIGEVCWGVVLPPEGDHRLSLDGGSDTSLRAQVATYRAFLRLAVARDEAVARVLLESTGQQFQPSLFDRAALREVERRRLATSRCLDELLQHRQRSILATGTARVRKAVVAIFRLR